MAADLIWRLVPARWWWRWVLRRQKTYVGLSRSKGVQPPLGDQDGGRPLDGSQIGPDLGGLQRHVAFVEETLLAPERFADQYRLYDEFIDEEGE